MATLSYSPYSLGANQSSMATASSSYSSPPLTATTAPVQTLPTPPTSESEIGKSFPLPGRDDYPGVGNAISSSMASQMTVATEANTPSSSMLSRRQNASLPAFSLPSSNIKSFGFNPMTSAGNTPSLLTPPSMGSDNLSPVHGGTSSLYSNGLSYWSQPTPSPSAYSSYSSAPNGASSIAYSSRNVYSPQKDRPSTPNSAEPYENGPYSAPVLSPHGTVVAGNLSGVSYGGGYPFHHSASASGGAPGSPHDQFSSASSLPPPTPHALYPHQQPSPYSYSSQQAHASMGAPHRPATSGGIPQLHPQPIHPAPPPTLTNLSLQNRYLPGMGMSSSLMSQHAGHLLAGVGHGLGPALPHPHLHHGHHGSHSAPQQDRPFKCDQCPQSFNRNHDLKRHRRIHLAVKPFPCPHCDKSFSRKDALKRHVLVKGCGSTGSSSSSKNINTSSNRDGSPSGQSASPPMN